MKKVLFLTSVVLGIFSCSSPNVSFVDPQPKFLESIEEIPVDYQGNFTEIGDELEELIVVTSTDVTIPAAEGTITYDSLIVKSNGNYLYVNVLNEQGYYELYVARLVRCLEYENIKVMAGDIRKENLKFFNIIDTLSSNRSNMYILDDLTVNQLNQYRNLGYNKSKIFGSYAEYKRNK